MKIFWLVALLSFGFAGSLLAKDPCEGLEEVLMNSWLLTINEADASSKDDILRSLNLVGTGGFKVKNIFNFSSDDASVVMSIYFEPDYYQDASRAKQVKDGVLAELLDISGVQVFCDSIMRPTPAIGVRPQ